MKTTHKITKHKKFNSFRKKITHKNYRKKTRKYVKKNNITRKRCGGNILAGLYKIFTKTKKNVLPAASRGIRSGIERPINNEQLIDNLIRQQNIPIQETIKQDFTTILNMYDRTIDPLHHVPMDKYGRYQFTTPGEGIPKSGNITPYTTNAQETWSKFKSDRSKEEYVRQNVPNITKKMDVKSKTEDEEDGEEDIDDSIDSPDPRTRCETAATVGDHRGGR